jgi:hypothetical protein
MSPTSVTIVKADRPRGSRRFAPPFPKRPVAENTSFAYLRNLPVDFPNAMSLPGLSPRTFRPQTKALLFLISVCILLRVAMALRISGICPDGVMYIRLATALEDGRFREAFSGLNLNLYPPILMFLHGLGLDWDIAGAIWGTLTSSLAILPIFGLFRRQFDDNVALMACALYATHPVFLQWSPELIRDPTFWLLFAAMLYYSYRAAADLHWKHFFAAGAMLTLAVFTRFEGLFLVVPLLFWTFWHYRALEERSLRRRLIFGTAMALVTLPAMLFLINLILLTHHSNWVLTHVTPLNLIERWWQGTMGSASEAPDIPVELRNISLFRLLRIYVPTLVKGLSPIFAILMLLGLWNWRKTWARRDHQPLFYASLVLMAAAWIHAWCAHESCDRYYLPIAMMASPYAALGLLAICRWMLRFAERNSLGQRWCRAAVVLLVAIVLVSDLAVAFGHGTDTRGAEVELGKQLRRTYGPEPLLFGSEGVTAVIAHYCGGRYETLAKIMDDRTALDFAREKKPAAILIVASRRFDLHETRRLIDECCKLGYREYSRDELPPGIDDVLVVLGRQEKL